MRVSGKLVLEKVTELTFSIMEISILETIMLAYLLVKVSISGPMEISI
jgi:hypothetical protein